MKNFEKFKKVIKIAAMTGIGLASPVGTTDTSVSASNTTEILKTQIEPIENDSNIHWLPKDHSLPKGLTHDILNVNETNRTISFEGKEMRCTSFGVDFYGTKIDVIAIDDKDKHRLGGANPEDKTIVLNKFYLREAYSMTKELLSSAKLEKEIVPVDDMCESVLIQEMWHMFNGSVENKKQEYFSEYPSLDSRAGHFYLAAKFIDANISLSEKNPNENYLLVWDFYKKAFEIDKPTKDKKELSEKFKNLVQKYGFDGLIKRYKDYKATN